MFASLTGDTWNVAYYYILLHHIMGINSQQATMSTHTYITELVGSTKIHSRGFPNTSPEKQTS